MLWIAGIIALTSLGGLAVFVLLVVALPVRYFAAETNTTKDRHPVLYWLGIVAKNLLGVAIILLGVLLSLPGIPGQGILTILIGLVLLDFPGKKRLVRSGMRRPGVLSSLNHLRRLFHRPPLVIN